MPEGLAEIVDTAIYQEIASQALYLAGLKTADDPGARSLLKELAADELRHTEELKKLKDKGVTTRGWHQARVPDLMISEYLTGPDSLEGAGLQDLLIFAMKREGESVEFYSGMMAVVRDEAAKHLCEGLVHWELRHKLKLELLYDGLFYRED